MKKTTSQLICSILGILIAFPLPTIINVIFYFLPGTFSTWFLYLTPIVLLSFFTCLSKFYFKRPYHLFALTAGFLISPLLTPIGLSYAGYAFYGKGFGGEKLETVLMAIFYAIPFAALTVLSIIFFHYRKSEKNSDDFEQTR